MSDPTPMHTSHIPPLGVLDGDGYTMAADPRLLAVLESIDGHLASIAAAMNEEAGGGASLKVRALSGLL